MNLCQIVFLFFFFCFPFFTLIFTQRTPVYISHTTNMSYLSLYLISLVYSSFVFVFHFNYTFVLPMEVISLAYADSIRTVLPHKPLYPCTNDDIHIRETLFLPPRVSVCCDNLSEAVLNLLSLLEALLVIYLYCSRPVCVIR